MLFWAVWTVTFLVVLAALTYVGPEPRSAKALPSVPRSSVDMAIAVYVDRYIRGVIEADELEIGVDRVLRDGGWVETGDDFVAQVGGVRRAPRPDWLRAAEDADIARRAGGGGSGFVSIRMMD